MARLYAMGALATAILLAGVAVDASAQAPAIELGAAPNGDAVALAEGGLDTALAELPEIVRRTMTESGVPGVAIAVVAGGRTVYAEGFGVREVGTSDPVTPETVFQIASVSKPLSATIAAIAISRGLASWDDPVVSYLPDLKLSDPWVTAHATIGDFFAHRTGLPFAAGDDLEDVGFRRDEIIARLHDLPLDAFRTSYHYANFGTTIAAEAIAAAAAEPWASLAEALLFQPLGMGHTSYRFADFMARPNRAVPHAFENGTFAPLYQRQPDAQAPAGGVSSNVLDLASWLQMLLAGGVHDGAPIIAPEVLNAMLLPHAFSAPTAEPGTRSGFYGYGWNVRTNAGGRMAYGHSGGFAMGSATYVEFMRSAGVGIVVLTNGSPIGVPESIAASVMDIVQYGRPTRDWYPAYNARMLPGMDAVGAFAGASPPPTPATAHHLDLYAGTYASDYFGPMVVTAGDTGLSLTIGPRGDTFALSHWDGDTFAMPIHTENAPGGSVASVTFGFEGDTARTVTIDLFDRNGLGVWTR